MKREINQKNVRSIVAANIKQLRYERNLSQELLAAKAGLHRTYIGAVERGERNISIENVAKIAETLGCSIKDLFNE